MTTQISNIFVVEYQRDVKHVFQREGSFLKPTTRQRGNVIGSSTKFNVIGKGSATTKARHGQVTPMNAARSQVTCTISDYYAGDWVDDLDLAKTEVDEKMAIARQGAMALGRTSDELIITALSGTTQTSNAWTLSSAATVESSAIGFLEQLWANDVRPDGRCYAVITVRAWSQLMKVASFARADWVGPASLAFVDGPAIGPKFKQWNGANWQAHVGLGEAFTGTTAAARKIYAYHQDAVGFAMAANAKNIATNEQVMADITWHGDHASWFVNHMFSAGSALIDDTGVIVNTFADSTAIVTS